jgi:hypothetical protein
MNKEQDLVTKQEPHVTSHNKKEGKTEVYLTALSDGIYKNVFSPSLPIKWVQTSSVFPAGK